MQIYIDESGTFVQPKRPNRVSAVGALVVPDHQATDLFGAFEALSVPWQSSGKELKGSTLSEEHVAAVIDLLGRFDVLFDIRSIDMGIHDLARVETFQGLQSAAVTANITSAHDAGWQEWGAQNEARMRGLSPQLFVQCMVTIYLVLDLIQAVTIYYVQRWPEELGWFQWRVDPKDTQRTELERLWTDVILPMAQSQSIEDPFTTMEGCDYSRFERFYLAREEMPTDLAQHVGPNPRDGGLDFKKILLEDLAFPDSRSETGLRIVDILVNTFCRAMNGNLGEHGWVGWGVS